MYFLNINKPKGITSFDVIKKLRQKLKIKQIGHSGTLDPLATGVLQVAVGSATKLLDFLGSDKTYIAKIKFGYISDTYDDEGVKTFIKEPDFTKDKLITTLNSFLGKSKQIPPKYSAIKQNGKKLCDLARNNPSLELKIEPREIEIYSIKLLNFNYDTAEIEVFCKKGTYIRSLIYDIGQILGCGAYMTELIRICAGNFKIDNSDDLNSDKFNKINPLDTLKLKQYELNDDEYQKIKNGNYIKTSIKAQNEHVLLTKNKKLVSLAIISDNQNGDTVIKPRKNFNEV